MAGSAKCRLCFTAGLGEAEGGAQQLQPEEFNSDLSVFAITSPGISRPGTVKGPESNRKVPREH